MKYTKASEVVTHYNIVRKEIDLIDKVSFYTELSKQLFGQQIMTIDCMAITDEYSLKETFLNFYFEHLSKGHIYITMENRIYLGDIRYACIKRAFNQYLKSVK